MTFKYLNVDTRPIDYFLTEDDKDGVATDVDLSDEFIKRYEDAVNNYDGIQAELDLIYRSKA